MQSDRSHQPERSIQTTHSTDLVSRSTLHKSRRPPLEVGDEYDRLRESLVQTELFLMRLLAFHVRRPPLPHSYLVHYLHSLLHWVGKGIAQPCGGGAGAGGTELNAPGMVDASTIALARLPGLAWSILGDSYHSTICLDFAPEHIAVAILHLSLRIAGVEIPGNKNSEMAWWQVSAASPRWGVVVHPLGLVEVIHHNPAIVSSIHPSIPSLLLRPFRIRCLGRLWSRFNCA